MAQLRKSADQGVHPRLLRGHLLLIPPALHDSFDTMTDRDNTSDDLLLIIQQIPFAQGRLRAVDLYFAISFNTGPLSRGTAVMTDRSGFEERWLRNFILTSSKGFLKPIDIQSNAYMPCEFIHESVR